MLCTKFLKINDLFFKVFKALETKAILMLKMDNKSAKEDVIVKNKGSLIQTIKSFERCMADMKSTVLVPTRLNDIDSQTMAKSGVNCIRSDNENLYNVYNDLQKISKLLYGDRHQSDLKYAKYVSVLL